MMKANQPNFQKQVPYEQLEKSTGTADLESETEDVNFKENFIILEKVILPII